jgi:uncharacterized phiE125 gp8 family phage protein
MADTMPVDQMRLALGSAPDATDDDVRAAYAALTAGWATATTTAQSAVDLDDLKQHLRIDGDDEDGLLAIYAAAGEAAVESHCGRALTRRIFTWSGPSFDRIGSLPRRPVRAIDVVSYWTPAGIEAVLPVGSWRQTADGIVGAGWPAVAQFDGSVTVTYEAGYDDDLPLPAALKNAALMMAAFLYRNRDAGDEMPAAVAMLCRPFRRVVMA